MVPRPPYKASAQDIGQENHMVELEVQTPEFFAISLLHNSASASRCHSGGGGARWENNKTSSIFNLEKMAWKPNPNQSYIRNEMNFRPSKPRPLPSKINNTINQNEQARVYQPQPQKIKTEIIDSIESIDGGFKLKSSKGDYEFKSVIIASGASARWLGIEGELSLIHI